MPHHHEGHDPLVLKCYTHRDLQLPVFLDGLVNYAEIAAESLIYSEKGT